MSKIDELCPDGVEYRPLGEVGEFVRGNGIQKRDFVSEGYPCIHYGQLYTHYRTAATGVITYISEELASKRKKAMPGDLVIATTSENAEDVCKAVAWLGQFPVAVSGDAYIYRHSLNSKYVSYFFQSDLFQRAKSKYVTGTKVLRVSGENMARIRIPVPPVEVQEEIVRILDSFSALEAELEAELEARKKQYAYYRDKLLTFSTDIRHAPLSDLCNISRGRVISKGYIAAHSGKYPVYSSQTLNDGNLGGIDSYDYDGEYLTWTTDGANAGSIFHRKGRFSITNVCGLVGVNSDEVKLRYLYYWLSFDAKRHVSTGMGNPKLMSNVMGRIRIPVPPMDVQERIVEVLDNFDALCSDLGIGLPAELEARRKQYEYYRDSLLTFLEKPGTVVAGKQASRQAGKQASRQAGKQASRQAGKQASRQAGKQASRQAGKQASRQAGKQAELDLGLIKILQYVFGYAVVQLSAIASISRGGSLQKKHLVADGVPCIHYGQIYTQYGVSAADTVSFLAPENSGLAKWAQSGDIVMAVTSENIEDVCKAVAWLGDEMLAVSGHTAIISHGQNPKYLSYWLRTPEFGKQKRKLAHGTKVIEVTPSHLGSVALPLPSLEKQAEIVAVLDKFDALVNDLSSGLPAELEARRKQYEHYRDALLDFPTKTEG